MAAVEEIKQEIRDWYGDHEEPLIAAFTSFIAMLAWRRAEITLPSGIAKALSISETEAIFYVGEQTFAVYKDRDRILDDGTIVIADWQVDDLAEVEPVNVVVTEFQPKDSTDSI